MDIIVKTKATWIKLPVASQVYKYVQKFVCFSDPSPEQF